MNPPKEAIFPELQEQPRPPTPIPSSDPASSFAQQNPTTVAPMQDHAASANAAVASSIQPPIQIDTSEESPTSAVPPTDNPENLDSAHVPVDIVTPSPRIDASAEQSPAPAETSLEESSTETLGVGPIDTTNEPVPQVVGPSSSSSASFEGARDGARPKAVSEDTPLLSSSDSLQREQFYRPAMLEDPAGPVPEIHSRFGLRAFLDDISDVRNGSVPISVLIASVIGLFCGVAAFFYYSILEFFLEYLWETLPEQLAHAFPIWKPYFHWLWIPIMGMSMAAMVGLSIKLLGFPGDLAYTVKCVHKDAYVPMNHAPSMVVASQVSILGGGSLGPEAPLVAICASIAGWVSITLFRQRYKNVVRKHTLCGMACALAAFFGVPLGGSLFALEINNRLGYEYFEHALEAILSGTVCLVVFRAMAGLPIGPIWSFTGEKLGDSSATIVCLGAFLGLIGAGFAAIFAHGHWAVVKKLKAIGWEADPLKLSIFGGVGICTLGLLVPHSMFWGEFEIQTIGSLSPASALTHIWPKTGLTSFEITNAFTAFLAGVAKLIAISFTVAGGYRGGFIFPFFCAGTAFGRCVTYMFPSVPPTVAILSIAAGINVTITRTALATPLILAGLSGEVNSTSPVLAASLAAVFVTYYMPFIFTQQGREEIFESQLHSYTFKDKWGEIGEAPEIKIPEGTSRDIESH